MNGLIAALTIVLAEGASDTAKFAAEELERLLDGAEADRIRLEECDRGVQDWFGIRKERRDEVVIRGNSRGVLYGVYELLRRFGGYEWYTPSVCVTPKLERLEVPVGTDFVERAAFVTRETSWWPIMSDPVFALRRRMNGTRAIHKAPERGIPVKPALRFCGELWICHTFERLVPGTGDRQPCLSDPEVLRTATEKVLDVIRRHPEADIFGVSQNDNANYCRCPKCQAVAEEEGSQSGPVIRFVNAIAERVEREFPGRIIETLAYQYSRRPPKKTKPRDNVMICLCSIELDFSKPIVGNRYRENLSFMRDLEEWRKLAAHLYLWDYTVNFPHYPDIFPNVETIAGNLAYFRDHGVRHMLEQGAGEPSRAWFAELKSYVISEYEWNPDQDLEKKLDGYFAAVYGPAAPYVRRYYDQCRAAYVRDETAEPMTFSPGLGRNAVSERFYEEMAQLLDRALKAVKGDCAREAAVKDCVFWNDYTRALRMARGIGTFISRHPENYGDQRLRPLKSAARRVLEFSEGHPEERFCEHADKSAEIKGMLGAFLDFKPPEEACDAAVFEEDALNPPMPQYGEVVDDREALNGRSTKRKGGEFAWSGGFYIRNVILDPGVKYRVRMRVRCEFSAEAKPEDIAFSAGVYSHTFKCAPCHGSQFRVSETKPGYAWYETEAWVPREGDFLWFSPRGSVKENGTPSPVENVFFDCFELRRAEDRP